MMTTILHSAPAATRTAIFECSQTTFDAFVALIMPRQIVSRLRHGFYKMVAFYIVFEIVLIDRHRYRREWYLMSLTHCVHANDKLRALCTITHAPLLLQLRMTKMMPFLLQPFAGKNRGTCTSSRCT